MIKDDRINDLVLALKTAETILMVCPDITTNANGTRLTTNTKSALQIVRDAIAKEQIKETSCC